MFWGRTNDMAPNDRHANIALPHTEPEDERTPMVKRTQKKRKTNKKPWRLTAQSVRLGCYTHTLQNKADVILNSRQSLALSEYE